MALKPCHDCGKEVSTDAKKCTHCGAANRSNPVVIFEMLSSSIIGIMILWFLLSTACKHFIGS